MKNKQDELRIIELQAKRDAMFAKVFYMTMK